MDKRKARDYSTASGHLRGTIWYCIIVIMTFAVLQSLVVVMHEFTHSTMAWLLGYTVKPFSIIWGNPIMMTGWDEGVPYSRLFASGHHAAEAIIGGSPLLLHSGIVIAGMVLLQRRWLQERKWYFHLLYWFVIANLMELIAYCVMRAFAAGGDVGHFNRGLGLSPWLLFITGTLLITGGLYIFFQKIMPRMYALFARNNRMNAWAILGMTAFFLFLWGSGIRVVVYIYPDPQWLFGLSGFAAFVAVMIVCNPKQYISQVCLQNTPPNPRWDDRGE